MSLLDTNPYLKDPELRDRLIERSVVTSCGVEGIKVMSKTAQKLKRVLPVSEKRMIKELSKMADALRNLLLERDCTIIELQEQLEQAKKDNLDMQIIRRILRDRHQGEE